ncbi:MAG TPA: carboxypeptidase-like regulatory domain-containing protein [Pyrinomonadaceae bacterium]|nr:carboxypeptidase-like regulatory domain-containing protein [Pyrinomonadaceae bacterium]
MKNTIILLLILAATTYGQHMNSRLDAALPAPSAAGNVTLSLGEFNRLIELATHKPKTPAAAPLPFALSRAAFKLRVEKQAVVGSADIDIALLQKGPIKVPLASNLIVLEAGQAGNPLPLMQEGPTHAAILIGPGSFTASLKIASGLTVEAGRASFILPVPAAGSSLLTLELPGNHANVRIEPGLVTGRSSANGQTIIEATLESGKPARVWWTTREVTAPVAQREVRFLSDIKSVISVGDSQLRLTALCDLTVIQGEPAEFRMPLPKDFELTEVTGSTLDSYETDSGVLILRVREPARRIHQFLVAIERASKDTKLDTPFLAFAGVQRETGELLVEGLGAMDLTAAESGGLRRMDVREAGAVARSLARFPLQAAFRYNRHQGDTPKLQLEWRQFPDASVISAVAERATVTTLTNVEGKTLTEVTLRVRNHAQPFVKIELPPDTQLLSAEVEGERVKPVVGPDGSRVPLLRTGFNPSGAYTVSFVYLSSGARFTKRGAYEMGLPKLDIPVNLLTWEVSLPDRLEVKQFGGNALAAELFPVAAQNILLDGLDEISETDGNVWSETDLSEMEAGQIGGIVLDPNGAVIPNATITVTNKQTGAKQSARSDGSGRWVISGMQSGPVSVNIASTGFTSWQQDLDLAGSRGVRLGTTLQVLTVSETVNVTSGAISQRDALRIEEQARKSQAAQMNAPSQNVYNLQRRVAGVLPVRVEVPRAGKSYRFVRPLVLEEETKITFAYRSK